MNLQASETKPNAPQKIGFLSSFIASCLNLGFYTRAHKASWLHVTLHALVLIFLITVAYSSASYNLLKGSLEGVLKDIPTLQVKNGEIVIPENLELPYVKKFPQSAGRQLVYLIDSGENKKDLEEEHEMYVLFTKKEAIFNDGKNRVAVSAKKLQEDPALKSAFFGEPFTISPANLAKFAAFYTVGILGFLFFFLPMLLLFPTFNLLAASLASVMDRWPVGFPGIFKMAIFAATPACVIQIFGCFLLVLNWTVFAIGLLVSWSIQIAYLVTGLRACKAVA